jgi:hypothetical protein
MPPISPPASFLARLGVVLGATVLQGALNMGLRGEGGVSASFSGCVLALLTLAWLNGQGRNGASPERPEQTGPTPIDRQTVPTVLTIAVGFLSVLGPFFGLVALGFYFMTALDPKRRKEGRQISLSELLPLLLGAGDDREKAAKLRAAFQESVVTQAAAAVPSEPAPKPKPKAPAARPATERLVPPSTWGTLAPSADTRADWFNEPVAERAIAQADPAPGLAPGEVAPFHVAPASALGDWSLGTSSSITTSSVQTVSYDHHADPLAPTDTFASGPAPSGFDEALAMLQAKPGESRRD